MATKQSFSFSLEACDHCTQLLLDELDEMYFTLTNTTSHLQTGVTPPWSKLDDYEHRYARSNDNLQNHKSKSEQARKIIEEARMEFFEKKLPKLDNTIHQRQRELDDLLKDGDQLLKDTDASSQKLDKIKERILEIINNLNSFGSSHETTKNALAKARKLLKEIKGVRNKFKAEYDYKKVVNDCERVNEYAANVSSMLVYPDVLKEKLSDFTVRLADLKEIALKTDLVNAKVEALNLRNRERINNLTGLLESFDLYGVVDSVSNDINEVKEISEKIKNLLNKTRHNYDTLRANKQYIQLLEFLEEKEKTLREQNPQIQEYLEKVEGHVRNLEKNVTEYQKYALCLVINFNTFKFS